MDLLGHQMSLNSWTYSLKKLFKNLNFILYLFYNNNTQLQIGHKVILLDGEYIRNIFGQRKPLKFLPWMKNPNTLMDWNPRPPSTSVVVITPRLAHCLNHSATEHLFWRRHILMMALNVATWPCRLSCCQIFLNRWLYYGKPSPLWFQISYFMIWKY